MKKILSKFFDKTWLKYNLVGLISTAVGYSMMFCLRNFINWHSLLGTHNSNAPYWITSAANYLVAGVLSYNLNRKYTFGDTRPVSKSIFKFTGCFIVSYLISHSIAKPLTLSIMSHASVNNPLLTTRNDNIAQFVGLIIFVTLNYVLQRFVSFNRKQAEAAE